MFFFLQIAAILTSLVGPVGRFEKLGLLEHPGVAAREVTVWLPANYDSAKRYAVLYVHDGQMQFDPSTTWNGKAWKLDEAANRLLAAGKVRDFIVVAVPNDPDRRHAEFFPQSALRLLEPPALRQRFVEQALGGRPAADDYLRFLVKVVKPAVDTRFSTHRDRDSTFIMGSSMGGLISLYAICEYPEIFGGAAALSTHWIGSYTRNEQIPAALRAYLELKLPAPDQTRIYLDRGTETLDALYDEAQPAVDRLMQQKGYGPANFVSRVFEGAGHDEIAWAARVDIPLEFLLGSPEVHAHRQPEVAD